MAPWVVMAPRGARQTLPSVRGLLLLLVSAASPVPGVLGPITCVGRCCCCSSCCKRSVAVLLLLLGPWLWAELLPDGWQLLGLQDQAHP